MYGIGVPVPTCDNSITKYQPTLTERLKCERGELQSRLTEVNAAIAALEANPQVQAVLDLVQKVARY